MKVTVRNAVHEVLRDAELNDVMEFDHVVRSHGDGTVSHVSDVWAPELHDGELSQLPDRRWSLMSGYTGQYGYDGPIMHQSEYISGRLGRDILIAPGLYVALVDYPSDDTEPEGWAVAYILE